MSASYYWRPESSGKLIFDACPGETREILEEAFGAPPWQIGPSHVMLLQGIAACHPRSEFWRELIDITADTRIILEIQY